MSAAEIAGVARIGERPAGELPISNSTQFKTNERHMARISLYFVWKLDEAGERAFGGLSEVLARVTQTVGNLHRSVSGERFGRDVREFGVAIASRSA